MVIFRILRSNGFRRSPVGPPLRSSTSLAAQEIPADASAASKQDDGDPTDVAAKPRRSLSSIFAKPTPAVSPARKTPAPDDAARKERKKGVISSSNRPSYRPMEEKDFPESLSPEAAILVSRLQEGGYLKDAKFSNGGMMEPHQIPATLYSRHFLKSAAEKFGQDNQEIAKWLSGSHLKMVALFGCPSVERKTVYAAKRLRSFFNIQEDIVCRGCKLKTSCKFMNQRVGRQDKVILADVMRVATLLALDSVPRQLLVPGDLKLSVGKLMKEVVSLSS